MKSSKDPARKWTDKELAEMRYHIGQIYEDATEEITAKWDAYMFRAAKRLDKLHDEYVTAADDEKEEALKKYQDALKNVTFRDKYYKDMVLDTTRHICKANEIATAYMNGEMPKIYRVNYDQIDPAAMIPGIKYDMLDENAVRHLIKDGTIPQKKIDPEKDITWNTKQIGSSVLQGIIQGESIKDIAKRLMPIVDKNEASAIRNARTMTTCAENRGRLDRYADYESKGLVMAKVWIATGDNRTRDWHLSMDGQEVSKDEEFTDGQGNKLMYPGDPDAEPQTTWNCRCSMRSHILGVRGKDGEVTPIPDMHESGLHQEQIAAEMEKRGLEPAAVEEKEEQPKEFPEIKTRAEAMEVAKSMFASLEKNLSKIDEQLFCENITQLKRLNDKFGVLTENNKGYFTSSPSGRAIAWTSTDFSRRRGENTCLSLVSRHYNNRETFIENENRATDSFYSMPAKKENIPIYAITHEYGHMLESVISQGRVDYNAFKERIDNYNPALQRKEWIKLEKQKAKDIYNEILDIAKADNPDFSLKDNLSQYGHTNHFEFFAEVFANSQCGAPNELGRAMLKWLEKEGY
jgi:hypothetical protein